MDEGGARGLAEVERRRLEARKRTLYQLAALFALVVVVLSWITREPGDLIVERGYPFLGLLLGVFSVLLASGRVPLRPLELTMYASLGVVILGRLYWHLHLSGLTLDDRVLVLAGAHYWAVGAVVIAGFVLLDRRAGALAGSGVLGASAVMVAAAVIREAGSGPFPVEPTLYLVRVHGFLALLLVLVSAIAGMREQLHRALARAEVLGTQATTDPVTGLANRWAGEEALAREHARARRHARPLTVALMDLDHFKQVNDRHGHAVGDQVLAVVAEVLRDVLREADHLARWGGEEFLLVLPDTHAEEAVALAERCRAALVAARPAGLTLTASFGVAELAPSESREGLLARADTSLYSAKEAGRDQVGEAPAVG